MYWILDDWTSELATAQDESVEMAAIIKWTDNLITLMIQNSLHVCICIYFNNKLY